MRVWIDERSCAGDGVCKELEPPVQGADGEGLDPERG